MLKHVKNTFRSFKYYNYRLFFLGQGLSLTGTWMQQVASPWLVYKITNSSFLLGLTSFVALSPNIFITPFSGVIADRKDRRNVLYFTQINMMLSAFLLAFFYFKGHGYISYPIILILSLYTGIMNALDAPTRHAFVYDIVNDKQDLPNAIALNSAMFNGARFFGPTLAGIVLAKWNEGGCFLINGISFVAVLIALFFMKLERKEKVKLKKINFLDEFKEGLNYTVKHKGIMSILIIVVLVSIFGMSYPVILPVYVKEILHKEGDTLGFLLSIIGVGALVGSIFIASLKNINIIVKQFFLAGTIFGSSLIVISLVHNIYLLYFFLFTLGFGVVSQVSSGNTLIPLFVDDKKRGRVMSLYNMAFLGSAPLGSLLTGFLIKRNVLGITKTLIILGLVCASTSLFLILNRREFKKVFK
ncbi:TPA: MFS transporter [candidate division WOR-3 bacterium]|uniref:Arabinose efflux permease n=1 Tax=candidate division TA06 bacterium 34_109 TaxID=1635277 RepID=A0A101I1R3_UNCT6|nr:MAG: Arabinose efflux permease [candidate division TA06 bacterium 34_109]HCP16474.1 MFS transporter [candidate division WOR-3 bacterium]